MRPLRVELQGFSTFKESTEIDFGDTDLLAFVGPTGSGKSSIIDAFTFALYGSVSRYDDARLVAPVISQGANEARVRLDFELAGRSYVAVRVVRRTKTGASTKEARLELLDATENESPVLASGAKELTEAVEQLIGLDFSQFTRTVVLPQGEFAEFLKDDPASRQKLLRRLLDLEIYSRMGAAARKDASTAEQGAEVYQRQIEENSDITPALLAEHQKMAAALSSFVEEAAGQLEAIAELESQLELLRAEVNASDANAKLLADVGMPESVGDEIGRVDGLRAALEEARTELEAIRERQATAKALVAESGDVRRLEVQAEAAERLVASSAELDQLQTDHRAAVSAADDAAKAEELAAAQLQQTTAIREKALVGSKAADWVSTLSVGAPCPVCQQDVVALPDHDPAAELVAAEAAWTEASERALEASQATRSASTTSSRLHARIEERRAGHETLVASVADAPADLAEALQEARTAAAALATADKEVDVAEQKVRAAEASSRSAEEREVELRQAFSAQRDLVAALGPPPAAGSSLLDDWGSLKAWADEQAVSLADDRVAVAERGKVAASEKSRIGEQLLERAKDFGLAVPIEEVPAALTRAQAELAGSVERVKVRLADISGWTTELDALTETRLVYSALGRQLSATGFERWLLAEALDDLVERATLRLHELSSGQYSLAADDSVFAVVDHRNADERRDVRTLSGGETFLASLALALALADSIAELAPVDAPRLGSMFLDEGFGTLDTETLDVVATAIEELSAAGRLVGIVTHIEALAERMPVQIVVSKGPSTSTVERRSL